MEDLKLRVVRGGFAKLCGQAVTLALRLGYLAVMARLLNPEDFGLVAMVTVVTGVFEIFTSAGLSSATIQRATVTDEQVSTLFWINVLVGTILGLLCLVAAPGVVKFYHEPRLFWVTVAMGAGFLFNAAGVQHSALLQRRLRYVELTTTETLSQLMSYALGISMALGGYGYWALVASTVASPAINTACMWAIAAWVPGMPHRKVEIRAMLYFGGTITLNALIVYVAYNFEKLLLGRFWGADVLGIYGRANQLIHIPTLSLHAAVGGVAFAALSRLQDDPMRLKNYFLRGYTLVNSITMPVTFFCALFADDIVLVVLGAKWTDAAVIFRLLTPTVLVLGIINPTSWLLLSIGLQARSLRIALVIAPLVITAYFVGLPYGPNGVAFAYSAAMTLWLVPHVVWCLHNTPTSPWDLFLATWRPLLASIVAGAVAFGTQFYLGQLQSPLLRLFTGGSVLVGFYLAILLFVMGQKTFYLNVFRELKSTPQ